MKNKLLIVVLSIVMIGVICVGYYMWQQIEQQKLEAQQNKLEAQQVQKDNEEKVALLEQQIEQQTLSAEKRTEELIDQQKLEAQQTQKDNEEKAALLKQQILSAEKKAQDIKEAYCKGAWKNGVCIVLTCIDSDVNEKPNDIFIKGSVTSTDLKGISNTVYDECAGGNEDVGEGWCYETPKGSGNYGRGLMMYDCPKGCLDGACIK